MKINRLPLPMLLKRLFLLFALAVVAINLAACQQDSVEVAEGVPTATLAPIVSQTPRLTATLVPTRTPLPTATPVPPTPTTTLTPSNTPTPTEPPPVIGVVNSIQRVNVRTGPGITYRDFAALAPGTGVEIIGQSSDGKWLNVQLEDGDQGWMAASLLRIQPTPTMPPTFTPTVDETAIALGTTFPTAVIGGGTVTATPPAVIATIVSPTPVVTEDTATPEVTASTSPTPRTAALDSTPVLVTNTPSPSPTAARTLVVDESVLPVIDIDAINLTATALSALGAAAPVSPTPTLSPTPDREAPIVLSPTPDRSSIFGNDEPEVVTPAPPLPGETAVPEVTGLPTLTPQVVPAVTRAAVTPETNTEAVIRNGVDVLAYCNDTAFDAAPPDNLKAGSTVEVYWIWYASSEPYIQSHLESAIYDVRVNDIPLPDINRYRQPVQQVGADYAVSWFVPIGPLMPGEYEITYRVTWSGRTFDGYTYFGPGTSTLAEDGSCTFTVYE